MKLPFFTTGSVYPWQSRSCYARKLRFRYSAQVPHAIFLIGIFIMGLDQEPVIAFFGSTHDHSHQMPLALEPLVP
jgi:hypothetical protein